MATDANRPAPSSSSGDDTEISIFELALSLPEADRDTFVLEACQGSPALLGNVRERLSWERRMNGFLTKPLIPRLDEDQVFQTGDVIAGRFEIIRRAGEGGMAIVYEARDQKSEQRVAVKCPKHVFRKRLLRELKSALQVTHPNICRVHEIHTAATDFGEMDFLTMEFLEGETLSERLRREPRPALEEMRTIAAQICAGLAEAHARHVVHGDLKPGNVILTSDAEGGLRVVITDFGLAQGVRAAGESYPGGGSLRGTPDFIAPELWRGGQPSPASDIYALGVLLYGLTTGRRPFENISAALRLEARPEPVRKLFPQVPAKWDEAICACLAPAPAERPAELQGVFAARPVLDRRARWAAAAAVITCLIGGGVVAHEMTKPAPLPDVIRLAVLAPDTDGETSSLGNGIAIDLSSRLRKTGAGRAVTIIPLSQGLRYHVDSVDQAAGILGATHALRLRVRRNSPSPEIALTVYDAASRRPLRSVSLQPLGSVARDLPQRAAEELSAAFQSKVSAGDSGLHPESYLDYAMALYHLRQAPNLLLANSMLQRAEVADPGSPLVALARAEGALLNYRRTRAADALQTAEASLAAARTAHAANTDVLLLTARLHEAAGEPDAAVRTYDEVLAADPGQVAALRLKAEILFQLERSAEAVEALQKAIALQPGSFPPVLELGSFFYRQGRYDDAQREFSRATALAPKLWEAHHDLAAVFSDTARYDLAEREFQTALNLNRAPETLAGLGALMSYQKRHAEAVSYYEQAVAAGPEDHLLISNLGDAYRRTGRLDDSMATYRRALASAERDLAENPNDQYTRSFVAYLDARLGRKREAEAALAVALRMASGNMKVRRRGVLVREVLSQREAALALLESAPLSLIEEISRHPDLADLSHDARFLKLKDRISRTAKG